MALKSYNPVTPSQRQLVLVDRTALYRGEPVKSLTQGKNSSGGRNNRGRITVRFRGGGHKQAYRSIDFKRRKFDVAATVERIEYDPNRTAFIALLKYQDGELAYILAPQRLSPGDSVIAGEHVDVKPGNAMPAGNIPIGTIVHNVEIKIGKGGQIARSAGTYAQIVGRDADRPLSIHIDEQPNEDVGRAGHGGDAVFERHAQANVDPVDVAFADVDVHKK